jgi:ABC-type antimicrobial peptide transport system permease subunit
MFQHVIKKIKSNLQISVYHQLYIFVTILVVFLLLGFRDASVNKIESEVIFYKDSILINNNVISSYFPNGFSLTNNHIEEIEKNFQFVARFKTVSMDVSVPQHVNFSAVSEDFIETGVPFSDRFTKQMTIQKIDLIHGKVWGRGSKEAVVIIDVETANLIFGYTNVVGKMLPTIHRDLKIIGVVNSTNERQQNIAQAKEAEQIIDETMYASKAYISHGYLSTLSEVEVYNENIVIRDNGMKVNEVKGKIKDIIGIPKADNFIVQGRQEIIDSEITSRRVFFQIIVSLTSVFAFLGIINLINVSVFSYKINRKNIGIYKVIGCSNKQMIYISSLEGFILGIGSSIISIIIGALILIIGTVIVKTFIYLNFFNLLIISFCIISIFTLVVFLINIIATVFSFRRVRFII